MFLPESGAPCPPFSGCLGGTTPYVTSCVPPPRQPSRSIRTLSRVVLLSGTADPGTCPSPLLHHVCPSRSQTTDTTMPNYWWPPSPQHSDEETDDSQTEEEEDSSSGEEEDNEEHEDSDGQHRQHNAFWKGFRAAIKGYASSSSSEGEEEDDEGGVHRDRWNDKDDEDQDEHEQEDDGRPYSRSRTPRCSSRCKYYPCDRPIRSPRSSSPVVGPYRPSEAHLLESDYDSDVEENYVDIPVPPSS